jgi:ribosome-associated translation inhibitor RaiA
MDLFFVGSEKIGSRYEVHYRTDGMQAKKITALDADFFNAVDKLTRKLNTYLRRSKDKRVSVRRRKLGLHSAFLNAPRSPEKPDDLEIDVRFG